MATETRQDFDLPTSDEVSLSMLLESEALLLPRYDDVFDMDVQPDKLEFFPANETIDLTEDATPDRPSDTVDDMLAVEDPPDSNQAVTPSDLMDTGTRLYGDGVSQNSYSLAGTTYQPIPMASGQQQPQPFGPTPYTYHGPDSWPSMDLGLSPSAPRTMDYSILYNDPSVAQLEQNLAAPPPVPQPADFSVSASLPEEGSVCPEPGCHFVFTNSTKTNRLHRNKHTKPFRCAHCGIRYAEKKSRSRHIVGSHTLYATDEEYEHFGKLACPINGCNYEGRKDNLARHCRATIHRFSPDVVSEIIRMAIKMRPGRASGGMSVN